MAAAAILVVIFFAWALASMPLNRLMQLGVVIIMLGAVEIVGVLFWTRRRDALPKADASLAEFSQGELVRLDRQIALLRGVTWWYSGPVLPGAAIMIFGALWPLAELSRLTWIAFLLAFNACLLLAGFIVYRICQWAVEKELIPLRQEIEAFHSALLAFSDVREAES